MVMINRISNIISVFIKNEYYKYLNNNNILLIPHDQLKFIIKDMYNSNSKEIKKIIRNTLKNEMSDQYPSGSIENTLFDIFQDSEHNIDILTEKIINYQNNNYFEINKSIINNTIGIKLIIEDNGFCKIIDINKDIYNQDNIYQEILKYNYLYSIDGIVLNYSQNIQETIKNNIQKNINNNTNIVLGFYSLK